MPQQKKGKVNIPNTETAEETIAALNEMEENLRRLGLREASNALLAGNNNNNNNNNNSSGLSPVQAKDASQMYISSIKKAKENAVRLRNEKEYRQFAAEEQKRENEFMLSIVNKEKALRDVINKAYVLLEKETESAQEAVSKRIQKDIERSIKIKELEKEKKMRDLLCQVSKERLPSTSIGRSTTIVTTSTEEEIYSVKKRLKSKAAHEYCQIIAKGLIEVAMKVVEGMYTVTGENETPVRKVPRDLSVTQWRNWVDEFIFPKFTSKPMSEILATTTLRELRETNVKTLMLQKDENNNTFINNNGVVDTKITQENPEIIREILNNTTISTEIFNDNENSAYTTTAEVIIKRISEMQSKYNDKLIYSSVEDAIKIIKNYEEKKVLHDLDELRRQHECNCQEEAAPGWTHRLPPSGCFVYGDEFSGIKSLSESAYNETTYEVPLTQTKRRFSVNYSAELNKTTHELENSKWENNPYRIITPNMLIRTPQNISGQNVGSGFLSTFSKSFKGGSTMASTMARTKDSKQAIEEITESKQYIEALCDILTRELISVYQHNLQIVMRSVNDMSGSKSGSLNTLRSLILVGFPENEFFWRSLNQKLHNAMEATEQELNKALKEEEAGEETLPQPILKGKSQHKQNTLHEGGVSPARKKSLKQGFSFGGKKGVGRFSMSYHEEENIPTRVRVYPPMCILGIFLQYDVPSRFKRIQTVSQLQQQSPLNLTDHKFHKITSGVVTSLSEEEIGDTNNILEWPVHKLRHELIQQDKKMRKLWKNWCINVSKASIMQESEIEKPPPVEKPKKRSRLSIGRKTSDSVAGNNVSTPTPPSLIFPKVLFFGRKEDTTSQTENDNTVEFIMNILKNLLNPTLRSIIRNDYLISGQIPLPLRLSDYRFTPVTLAHLVEIYQRFQSRWNDTIIHINSFKDNINTPLTKDPYYDNKEKISGENIVLLETEMYRVFRTFSSDLLNFLTHNVFPPSLWSSSQRTLNNIDINVNGNNEIFSRTMHFMSVDGNYDKSRDELYNLIINGMSKLTSICALLLYCALDMSLISIGEGFKRLCTWSRIHILSASNICKNIDKNTPVTTANTTTTTANNNINSQSMANSTNVSDESWPSEQTPFIPSNSSSIFADISASINNAKEYFLEKVPRLSFEEVRNMVELLDGQVTSFNEYQQLLWTYASKVHQTALECFRNFIKTIKSDMGIQCYESLEEMSPHLMEVILTYLFAFSPHVKPNTNNNNNNSNNNNNNNMIHSPNLPQLASAISVTPHPSISISIARMTASIKSLRRCCQIASINAGRWVDVMYTAALTVPPRGIFPTEHRPINIAHIFNPPPIPIQPGGAPPPSLALELISSIMPTLEIAEEEEKDCWWETELELMLQNFSTYQKPMLEEEEFIHCVLQAQLNSLWRFLPSKVYIISQKLGVASSFLPKFYIGEEVVEEVGIMRKNSFSEPALPWLVNNQYIKCTKSPLVTEDEASRMFNNAIQAQQQQEQNQQKQQEEGQQQKQKQQHHQQQKVNEKQFQSDKVNNSAHKTSITAFSTSASITVTATTAVSTLVPERKIKKNLLYLREFFASAILQRLYLDDTLNVSICSKNLISAQEPSTMELRAMIKSLPRVVREQQPGDIPSTELISKKEWQKIKWWRFFDDVSLSKSENFIQRYLLRILTVCFAFVSGELCSRCVPFLPDVLSIVARTNSAQGTVERYFHALAALNMVRDKKLQHSQRVKSISSPLTKTTTTTKTTERKSTEESLMTLDKPLMAFDFTLSVDEALFFFHRMGEVILRGPCAKGLCHGIPNQIPEHRSFFSLQENDDEINNSNENTENTLNDNNNNSISINNFNNNNNNNSSNSNINIITTSDDDSSSLSLEAELKLLLLVENAPAISLPLLGSSHWGRYIIPRLTMISPEPTIPGPVIQRKNTTGFSESSSRVEVTQVSQTLDGVLP